MPHRPHVNLVSRHGKLEVLQVGKIQVKILEDGSSTGNQLGAVEAIIPAHTTQTPPHLHRAHVETILMRSGTLQFTVANGLYNVKEGEFLVVPIGAPHTFSNPFDTPAVFHASFSPASFIGYFREMAEITTRGMPSAEQIFEVMARYDTYPA